MDFHYPLLLQSVTKTILFPLKIQVGKKESEIQESKSQFTMLPEIAEISLFVKSAKHWGKIPSSFNQSINGKQQQQQQISYRLGGITAEGG